MRKLLYNCVTSRKLNCRLCNYPEYFALLDVSIQDNAPFSVTGVDLFGPILVKNVFLMNVPDVTYKFYSIIYTYMTTKVSALELVKDGSSSQFINFFVCFVS